MKIYGLILLCFLLFSCSLTKTSITNNDIIYIFSNEIENNIYDLIKRKKMNFCFDMRKKEDSYIVYISPINVTWSHRTHRKIYIKGELYPLILDTDYLFATTENLKEINDRLTSPDKDVFIIRKSLNVMYDRVYRIEFNKQGQVLSKNW